MTTIGKWNKILPGALRENPTIFPGLFKGIILMKKRTWFFYGILSLGFLGSPLVLSQGKIPSLVGQFGFDWLNPDQATCEKISPSLQTQFKSCEVHGPDSTGSFTGKKDFHSCKDGKSHEFMIFKTQARCTEELETMRANGD